MSDLHLQLSNPPLEPNQLLLKRGFLSFKGEYLLLETGVLCFLVGEVLLHVLLDLLQLAGDRVFDAARFGGKDSLQVVLLGP